MAKENVAQETHAVNLSDAQDNLYEATVLLSLTEWIERAKYLCNHIVNAAHSDGNLAEALKSNGIAYLNADWDSEQSDGLIHLHGFQRDLMS